MSWGEYEDVRVALSELRRTGPMNPAALGPALEPMLESGHWRDWVHPVTGVRHFDDIDAFIEHETQHRVDVILVALRPDGRFTDVVTKLESARRDRVREVHAWGTSTTGVRVTNSSDTDEYVIARLKRDDPELAAEVVAGSVSPHAAAVRAGIRRPRATFVTNDVHLAVAALLRHYDKNEIIEELS